MCRILSKSILRYYILWCLGKTLYVSGFLNNLRAAVVVTYEIFYDHQNSFILNR